MSWDSTAHFAHKCQIAWLDLLATGQNSEARVWGHIVDALFDGDVETALIQARANHLPDKTILAIRTAFHLTT